MRITTGSALLFALALAAPRARAHEYLFFEHLQGGVVHGITLVNGDLAFSAEDGGRIRRWTRDTLTGAWSFEHLDSGYDSRYLLRDVRFGDAQNGWACGYGGRVVRTTDGGQSWDLTSSPFLTKPSSSALADLYAVRFVFDTLAGVWRGWVCGFEGTLYTSADGGDNWTSLAVPATAAGKDLYGLAVQQPSPGVFTLWITGDNGLVLRSPNGGATWDVHLGLAPVNCAAGNLELWDVEMRDNLLGIATGGVGTGCGESFYTFDGGVSWTPITCFDSGGLPSPHNAWSTTYGVALGGTFGAVTCGYASQANVLTSPPLCWTQTTNPALSTFGYAPTFGVAASGNTALQSGMFNLVHASNDGGANWTNIGGLHVLRERDAACATDQIGCVTGQGFRILRSTDGMATFTQAHIGPVLGPSLGGIAVSPVNSRNWLAVGDLESGFPYVARSTNQGVSWTRLPAANFPPHLGALTELAFDPVSPQHALCVGAGGRILDTANLGTTFTNWNNGIGGAPNLNSVAFTAGGDAFVVGAPGSGFSAWRAIGAANAWSGVPLKDTGGATLTNVTLNAVACGAGQVWTVGNGGRMFQYDAGSNAFLEVVASNPPYEPAEDLVGVAIHATASETHVIIGGNNGGIRYTNGTIWTSPRSRLSLTGEENGFARLSSIQVFPMPGNPDAFRGYVFGRQFAIARFVGPGANW